MLKFDQLGLIGSILQNLQKAGYKTPTPIQEKSIPLILDGKDIIGIAQTGTGKTASFTLPVLQRIKEGGNENVIKALVLVPTRELATQIEKSFAVYGEGLEIKTLSVFGGVDQKSQVTSLREGVHVLIATPGRLLDLMEQGHVRLKKIEMLVLDEADRMLDMGFIEDLERIITSLPLDRQTLFFSATMPPEVMGLSRRILHDPYRVEVSRESSTSENVSQKVIFCKREDKFQLLKKILKEEERELVVVFTKTKNTADKVKEYLRFHRIAASLFHGDKSQEEREQALQNFKKGSMKVLIATDIAARGIDVQGITHVINFELPLEAESYIHRIGRTARAGKEGLAITFCDNSELPILERIQNLIQIKIPSETFKGSPESSGRWNQEGPVKRVTAPTPGKSQEKTAYLDHSKRQKLREEGAPKPKAHPGFRKKKKKSR